MIWYVILDSRGAIINIRPGLPHGNTRHWFTVDAERLLDAEAAALAKAPEYWAKVQAGAKPPPVERAKPKPKEFRCKCGRPRKPEEKECVLCDELARNAPVQVESVPRERRESDEQLILLLEVQRQWQQSPNVGKFTAWLGGRIAALRSVR